MNALDFLERLGPALGGAQKAAEGALGSVNALNDGLGATCKLVGEVENGAGKMGKALAEAVKSDLGGEESSP